MSEVKSKQEILEDLKTQYEAQSKEREEFVAKADRAYANMLKLEGMIQAAQFFIQQDEALASKPAEPKAE